MNESTGADSPDVESDESATVDVREVKGTDVAEDAIEAHAEQENPGTGQESTNNGLGNTPIEVGKGDESGVKHEDVPDLQVIKLSPKDTSVNKVDMTVVVAINPEPSQFQIKVLMEEGKTTIISRRHIVEPGISTFGIKVSKQSPNSKVLIKAAGSVIHSIKPKRQPGIPILMNIGGLDTQDIMKLLAASTFVKSWSAFNANRGTIKALLASIIKSVGTANTAIEAISRYGKTNSPMECIIMNMVEQKCIVMESDFHKEISLPILFGIPIAELDKHMKFIDTLKCIGQGMEWLSFSVLLEAFFSVNPTMTLDGFVTSINRSGIIPQAERRDQIETEKAKKRLQGMLKELTVEERANIGSRLLSVVNCRQQFDGFIEMMLVSGRDDLIDQYPATIIFGEISKRNWPLHSHLEIILNKLESKVEAVRWLITQTCNFVGKQCLEWSDVVLYELVALARGKYAELRHAEKLKGILKILLGDSPGGGFGNFQRELRRQVSNLSITEYTKLLNFVGIDAFLNDIAKNEDVMRWMVERSMETFTTVVNSECNTDTNVSNGDSTTYNNRNHGFKSGINRPLNSTNKKRVMKNLEEFPRNSIDMFTKLMGSVVPNLREDVLKTIIDEKTLQLVHPSHEPMYKKILSLSNAFDIPTGGYDRKQCLLYLKSMQDNLFVTIYLNTGLDANKKIERFLTWLDKQFIREASHNSSIAEYLEVSYCITSGFLNSTHHVSERLTSVYTGRGTIETLSREISTKLSLLERLFTACGVGQSLEKEITNMKYHMSIKQLRAREYGVLLPLFDKKTVSDKTIASVEMIQRSNMRGELFPEKSVSPVVSALQNKVGQKDLVDAVLKELQDCQDMWNDVSERVKTANLTLNVLSSCKSIISLPNTPVNPNIAASLLSQLRYEVPMRRILELSRKLLVLKNEPIPDPDQLGDLKMNEFIKLCARFKEVLYDENNTVYINRYTTILRLSPLVEYLKKHPATSPQVLMEAVVGNLDYANMIEFIKAYSVLYSFTTKLVAEVARTTTILSFLVNLNALMANEERNEAFDYSLEILAEGADRIVEINQKLSQGLLTRTAEVIGEINSPDSLCSASCDGLVSISYVTGKNWSRCVLGRDEINEFIHQAKLLKKLNDMKSVSGFVVCVKRLLELPTVFRQMKESGMPTYSLDFIGVKHHSITGMQLSNVDNVLQTCKQHLNNWLSDLTRSGSHPYVALLPPETVGSLVPYWEARDSGTQVTKDKSQMITKCETSERSQDDTSDDEKTHSGQVKQDDFETNLFDSESSLSSSSLFESSEEKPSPAHDNMANITGWTFAKARVVERKINVERPSHVKGFLRAYVDDTPEIDKLISSQFSTLHELSDALRRLMESKTSPCVRKPPPEVCASARGKGKNVILKQSWPNQLGIMNNKHCIAQCDTEYQYILKCIASIFQFLGYSPFPHEVLFCDGQTTMAQVSAFLTSVTELTLGCDTASKLRPLHIIVTPSCLSTEVWIDLQKRLDTLVENKTPARVVVCEANDIPNNDRPVLVTGYTHSCKVGRKDLGSTSITYPQWQNLILMWGDYPGCGKTKFLRGLYFGKIPPMYVCITSTDTFDDVLAAMEKEEKAISPKIQNKTIPTRNLQLSLTLRPDSVRSVVPIVFQLLYFKTLFYGSKVFSASEIERMGIELRDQATVLRNVIGCKSRKMDFNINEYNVSKNAKYFKTVGAHKALFHLTRVYDSVIKGTPIPPFNDKMTEIVMTKETLKTLAQYLKQLGSNFNSFRTFNLSFNLVNHFYRGVEVLQANNVKKTDYSKLVLEWPKKLFDLNNQIKVRSFTEAMSSDELCSSQSKELGDGTSSESFYFWLMKNGQVSNPYLRTANDYDISYRSVFPSWREKQRTMNEYSSNEYRQQIIDLLESEDMGIKQNSNNKKGAKQPQPQNDGYIYTFDNVFKMFNIAQRIATENPVVLIGESGIGKTDLLRHLASLVGVELLVLNVHAGTTSKHIESFLTTEASFKQNKGRSGKHNGSLGSRWIFFDEANTTPAIEKIEDIVFGGSLGGISPKKTDRFIIAVNPLRRFSQGEIDLFKDYTNPRTKTSRPAYTVFPLPRALEEISFNFGGLSISSLVRYTGAMVKVVGNRTNQGFMNKLASQGFPVLMSLGVRISLREVTRFIHLSCWFNEVFIPKLGFMTQVQREKERLTPLLKNPIVFGIMLSYYMCFIGQLPTRATRSMALSAVINTLLSACPGIKDFQGGLPGAIAEMTSCLFAHMCYPPEIVPNPALFDNLFVVFVAILNNIPLLLIGAPGTSKTVSLSFIAKNMKGPNSACPNLRKFPSVDVASFQGSDVTTSEEIVNAYSKVVSVARKSGALKSNDRKVVFQFDEVGLAECGCDGNALKCLHAILEPGRSEDGPEIPFVGISNYALDAAKMSRMLVHVQLEPNTQELELTFQIRLRFAIKVAIDNQDVEKRLLLEEVWKTYKALCSSYFEVIEEQERLQRPKIYGLRNFYTLVNDVLARGLKDLRLTIRKNFEFVSFDPKTDFDPVQVFYNTLDFGKHESLGDENYQAIKANLTSKGSRHIMVISEGYRAINDILSVCRECGYAVTMFSKSGLLSDNGDGKRKYVGEVVEKLVTLMDPDVAHKSGKQLVVLHGMKDMYASIYALLNQNYTAFGAYNGVRMTIGADPNQLCKVDENFRVVCLLDPLEVQSTDAAFVNRFEIRNDTSSVIAKQASDELKLLAEHLAEELNNVAANMGSDVISDLFPHLAALEAVQPNNSIATNILYGVSGGVDDDDPTDAIAEVAMKLIASMDPFERVRLRGILKEGFTSRLTIISRALEMSESVYGRNVVRLASLKDLAGMIANLSLGEQGTKVVNVFSEELFSRRQLKKTLGTIDSKTNNRCHIVDCSKSLAGGEFELQETIDKYAQRTDDTDVKTVIIFNVEAVDDVPSTLKQLNALGLCHLQSTSSTMMVVLCRIPNQQDAKRKFWSHSNVIVCKGIEHFNVSVSLLAEPLVKSVVRLNGNRHTESKLKSKLLIGFLPNVISTTCFSGRDKAEHLLNVDNLTIHIKNNTPLGLAVVQSITLHKSIYNKVISSLQTASEMQMLLRTLMSDVEQTVTQSVKSTLQNLSEIGACIPIPESIEGELVSIMLTTVSRATSNTPEVQYIQDTNVSEGTKRQTEHISIPFFRTYFDKYTKVPTLSEETKGPILNFILSRKKRGSLPDVTYPDQPFDIDSLNNLVFRMFVNYTLLRGRYGFQLPPIEGKSKIEQVAMLNAFDNLLRTTTPFNISECPYVIELWSSILEKGVQALFTKCMTDGASIFTLSQHVGGAKQLENILTNKGNHTLFVHILFSLFNVAVSGDVNISVEALIAFINQIRMMTKGVPIHSLDETEQTLFAKVTLIEAVRFEGVYMVSQQALLRACNTTHLGKTLIYLVNGLVEDVKHQPQKILFKVVNIINKLKESRSSLHILYSVISFVHNEMATLTSCGMDVIAVKLITTIVLTAHSNWVEDKTSETNKLFRRIDSKYSKLLKINQNNVVSAVNATVVSVSKGSYTHSIASNDKKWIRNELLLNTEKLHKWVQGTGEMSLKVLIALAQLRLIVAHVVSEANEGMYDKLDCVLRGLSDMNIGDISNIAAMSCAALLFRAMKELPLVVNEQFRKFSGKLKGAGRDLTRMFLMSHDGFSSVSKEVTELKFPPALEDAIRSGAERCSQKDRYGKPIIECLSSFIKLGWVLTRQIREEPTRADRLRLGFKIFHSEDIIDSLRTIFLPGASTVSGEYTNTLTNDEEVVSVVSCKRCGTNLALNVDVTKRISRGENIVCQCGAQGIIIGDTMSGDFEKVEYTQATTRDDTKPLDHQTNSARSDMSLQETEMGCKPGYYPLHKITMVKHVKTNQLDNGMFLLTNFVMRLLFFLRENSWPEPRAKLFYCLLNILQKLPQAFRYDAYTLTSTLWMSLSEFIEVFLRLPTREKHADMIQDEITMSKSFKEVMDQNMLKVRGTGTSTEHPQYYNLIRVIEGHGFKTSQHERQRVIFDTLHCHEIPNTPPLFQRESVSLDEFSSFLNDREHRSPAVDVVTDRFLLFLAYCRLPSYVLMYKRVKGALALVRTEGEDVLTLRLSDVTSRLNAMGNVKLCNTMYKFLPDVLLYWQYYLSYTKDVAGVNSSRLDKELMSDLGTTWDMPLSLLLPCSGREATGHMAKGYASILSCVSLHNCIVEGVRGNEAKHGEKVGFVSFVNSSINDLLSRLDACVPNWEAVCDMLDMFFDTTDGEVNVDSVIRFFRND